LGIDGEVCVLSQLGSSRSEQTHTISSGTGKCFVLFLLEQGDMSKTTKKIPSEKTQRPPVKKGKPFIPKEFRGLGDD
jgi:hypothetical protein